MTTRRINKAQGRADSHMAVFHDALDGVRAANADLQAEEDFHRAEAEVHNGHADHARTRREANERFVAKFESLLS